MTTVKELQKDVETLRRALTPRSRTGHDLIITKWCIDRGDGKNGFARFSIYNPEYKIPLTDEETKQILASKRR